MFLLWTLLYIFVTITIGISLELTDHSLPLIVQTVFVWGIVIAFTLYAASIFPGTITILGSIALGIAMVFLGLYIAHKHTTVREEK